MTLIRVMGFSVVLLGFYMLFANYLPQVEPDLSIPEEISTEGLDMDGMIALGEDLFSGKGTCTLCHNNLGRAPDTLDMDLALAFAERLVDPRNTGASAGGEGATAIEAYLRESMKEPSAFVVAGFGKKGTNDTESPMPIVDQPPIELTNVEMNAVIAFLQDRAGFTPTVPLPSADDIPETDAQAGGEGLVEAPESDVFAAMGKYACAACHNIEGSGADLGPALGGIASRMNRAEVMGAILDPNSAIVEGYDEGLMPDTFGEDMHASELLLITDYLLALPEAAVSDAAAEEVSLTGIAAVLEIYGCADCHDLEDSGADLGPALNGIGARMDAAQLRAAITDPNAEIAEGYDADLMPDYFGDDMSEGEMTLLLTYLTELSE